MRTSRLRGTLFHFFVNYEEVRMAASGMMFIVSLSVIEVVNGEQSCTHIDCDQKIRNLSR